MNSFTTGTGGSHNANTFQGLTEGAYLHNIPEEDALRNLIDSYRLRVADEYNFNNTRKEYSRYGDKLLTATKIPEVLGPRRVKIWSYAALVD